ncbi:hypothetical protein R1flu_025132 [Riccia fluitans]|uniref:BED-type domain-containing protein n=1 Tax=Riccia fluitans TaxID=41844 RepID=A0ABD1XWW2_9MARC
MASGSRRREGKSPELPELSEEGELMPQQQQQPRAPKVHQTVLPFVEPLIPRPSKYKEFGLPESKKELSIKVMEQFIIIRGQKNNVGVWLKCKWCGKEYGHNVTCLTQHFTSEFALRQQGNMELSAFRREGFNKHIKDCERASQQLKFKIRALNNKERERATELLSLHDMESTSRALDKEKREIESAFPSSIQGEPSLLYAGGPQGSDARPHKLNFSSPSSVANAGMEVADDDTLDAYFNVSSEILPSEEIRRYSIVDEIDTRKARALNVSEERLMNLTSIFGVECFPQVALNVPDVTLSTRKTRILQEIYIMPVERGDTQDISRPQKRAKPSFS